MRYAYGAQIAVVTPEGRTLSGQMGDWNGGDPVIHIARFQMESPASTLRQEGWQIPEIGPLSAYSASTKATIGSARQGMGSNLERTGPFHDTRAFESAVRQIINALLEADAEVSEAALRMLGPGQKAPEPSQQPKAPPQMRAVGRDPYTQGAKRAYCRQCGSYAHTTENCPLKDQGVL